MKRYYVLGVLIGAMLLEVLAGSVPASAHQLPVGCWGDPMDTDAFQQDGVDTSYNPDRYVEIANGVRSDIDGEAGAHCVRVTSLFVLNNNSWSNYVEFGWLLGYDCGNTFRTVPIAFAAWRNAADSAQSKACYSGSTTPDLTYSRFTLADANSDTVWYFTFKGTALRTQNMDFHDGLAIANSERKTTDDLSVSHFRTLGYVSTTTSFVNWTNLRELKELGIGPYLDPNYNCRKISNTEFWSTTSTIIGTDCPDGAAI